MDARAISLTKFADTVMSLATEQLIREGTQRIPMVAPVTTFTSPVSEPYRSQIQGSSDPTESIRAPDAGSERAVENDIKINVHNPENEYHTGTVPNHAPFSTSSVQSREQRPDQPTDASFPGHGLYFEKRLPRWKDRELPGQPPSG